MSVYASRQSFAETPATSPRTSHVHATLAFYTSGLLQIEAGEAARQTWRIHEGDLLLLPPGTRHRVVEARRAELWRLSFAPASVPAELFGAFERVREGASPVVAVPAARHELVRGWFGELARVGAGRGNGGGEGLVEQSLLTLLLAEAAGPSVGPWHPGIVGQALRFIERHALGPLTLREVAAAVGRSPAHVTTTLTRETGRSAVQWIIAHRMAEAERLLLRSDERVDVIAERVGYADPTHFIRLFRRTHGLTPAAWRIQNRAD